MIVSRPQLQFIPLEFLKIPLLLFQVLLRQEHIHLRLLLLALHVALTMHVADLLQQLHLHRPALVFSTLKVIQLGQVGLGQPLRDHAEHAVLGVFGDARVVGELDAAPAEAVEDGWGEFVLAGDHVGHGFGVVADCVEDIGDHEGAWLCSLISPAGLGKGGEKIVEVEAINRWMLAILSEPKCYRGLESLTVEESCVDWIVTLDRHVVTCSCHLQDVGKVYVKRSKSTR